MSSEPLPMSLTDARGRSFRVERAGENGLPCARRFYTHASATLASLLLNHLEKGSPSVRRPAGRSVPEDWLCWEEESRDLPWRVGVTRQSGRQQPARLRPAGRIVRCCNRLTGCELRRQNRQYGQAAWGYCLALCFDDGIHRLSRCLTGAEQGVLSPQDSSSQTVLWSLVLRRTPCSER
jgi:hypothetical protein